MASRRWYGGVVLGMLYVAIDLTLFILAALLCHAKANNLWRILEIIDETNNPAENLLVLCPDWTLEKAEQFRSLSAMPWMSFVLLNAAGFAMLCSSMSFWCSLLDNGACPSTPTPVAHRLVVFSLFCFGNAMLFAGTSFAIEWKTDGNPFYGPTDPRSFDGYGYYETDCFGYGGCSGSYVDVVAVHDAWCPTALSMLEGQAETLTLVGGILFGVTTPILLAGLIFSCCTQQGNKFRLAVATPSLIAALFGLVVGGIQYPVLLPFVFGHAIWQYARLLINRIMGVDQAAVDTSFRTRPTDDMVPGVIGPAPEGGIDTGPIDDGGYCGY